MVRGRDAESLHSFLADPGVKPYIKKELSPTEVQLKAGTSPARLRSLLRELDYLIELT